LYRPRLKPIIMEPMIGMMIVYVVRAWPPSWKRLTSTRQVNVTTSKRVSSIQLTGSADAALFLSKDHTANYFYLNVMFMTTGRRTVSEIRHTNGLAVDRLKIIMIRPNAIAMVVPSVIQRYSFLMFT